MKARTLAGLVRLRKQLGKEMPRKTRSATLVLGTWNIRNFDDNRFAAGHRTKEDLFYIAEIISHFDVIAVQEICDNLRPLKEVMWILGDDYDYIVTDITEGSGGNKERLGFIFDKSKVQFKGVAGELVLPDKLQIIDGENKRQFSRTPFMCSFQSGWFKFMFSTVHIYFGADTGPKYDRRVKEINGVAKFLAKRAERDAKKNKSTNHVLVGDFNIKRSGSPGANALKDNDFQIFENREGSNKDQTKFYDQISFRVNPDELRLAKSDQNHGVLQFFNSIYRPRDFPVYKDELHKVINAKISKGQGKLQRAVKRLAKAADDKAKARAQKAIDAANKSIVNWSDHLTDDVKCKHYYQKEWRTFHASDHLPLWVELEIDFSGDYLENLAIK